MAKKRSKAGKEKREVPLVNATSVNPSPRLDKIDLAVTALLLDLRDVLFEAAAGRPSNVASQVEEIAAQVDGIIEDTAKEFGRLRGMIRAVHI